jgi:hypothetical protein
VVVVGEGENGIQEGESCSLARARRHPSIDGG